MAGTALPSVEIQVRPASPNTDRPYGAVREIQHSFLYHLAAIRRVYLYLTREIAVAENPPADR
jgi:hypothetical protein